MKLEAKSRLHLTAAKVDANAVLETLVTACRSHLQQATSFKMTPGHKYSSTAKYAKSSFEIDVSFKGEKSKATNALRSFLKKKGFVYLVVHGSGRWEKKAPNGLARVSVWGEDSTEMHLGFEIWGT